MNIPVARVPLPRKSSNAAMLVLAALLLLMFLLLGFNLSDPNLQRIDDSAGKLLRNGTNGFLYGVAGVFDFLGSTAGFALLTLIFAAFCFIARRVFDGCLIVAATIGAWVLNTAAKNLFARPRPELDALFMADGYSYPSGNATITAALFGMAAIVLASGARGWAPKIAIAALCALLIAAMGIARIYAGVHYPTDIIGGYLLGSAYTLVLVAVRERKAATAGMNRKRGII